MAAVMIRVRQLFVGPDFGSPGYTPPTGRVTLQLSTPLNDPAGNREFDNAPITSYLDADGYIDIPVVATNCIGLDPSVGVFYVVTERITGSPKRSYQIEVPKESASGELWLSDVAPALPGPQQYTYALQSALDVHIASAHSGLVRPPGLDITKAPYNAVPGLTPQTTKFYQAAYDLAVNDGGRIWVPGEFWAVDGEFGVDMTDFDNVEFWGEGASTQVYNVDPDVMGVVFTFRSCKSPKVMHMLCDQYAAQADRTGLTNIYFLDCDEPEAAWVRQTRADNFGIWMRGGQGGAAHHNRIGYGHRPGGLLDEFGGDGIHIGPGHPDADVHDNWIDGTGDDGIGVTSEGVLDNDGTEVHSNKVKRTGAAGISVWGGTDISVHHNKVKDTFVEGIVVRVVDNNATHLVPPRNIRIQHNHVHRAGFYEGPFFAGKSGVPCGIAISPDQSQLIDADDIDISGNKIGDCRNTFIRIGGNAVGESAILDYVLERNNCYGTVYAGVEFAGQTATGIYPGILISQGRDVDLVRNKVANAPQQAIHILGNPPSFGMGITGKLTYEGNVSKNCFTEADGGGTGNAWSIYTYAEAIVKGNRVIDPNGHLGIAWFFGPVVNTPERMSDLIIGDNDDNGLGSELYCSVTYLGGGVFSNVSYPQRLYKGAWGGNGPPSTLGNNGDWAWDANGAAAFKNIHWHKESGAWVHLIP